MHEILPNLYMRNPRRFAATVERSSLILLGMGGTCGQSITELLAAWGAGDRMALESLVPLVEAELRRTARAYLRRERSDSRLDTTVMINEVFLRLIGSSRVSCSGRTHFYALCARLMRQILVDRARARRAAKRDGGGMMVPAARAAAIPPSVTTDILAIDAALNALARSDPRKAQVVELRFFGGLTVEETAEALAISPESVMRDWRLAKAWLLRELSSGVEPA